VVSDVHRRLPTLQRAPVSITWERLRDGALLRTPNAGCAPMLWPGDAVLGRAVPTEGQQIFESAPLQVTHEVAHRVAADRGDWLAALGDWDLYSEVVPLIRPTEHHGLLVELPSRVWQNVVCDQPDTSTLPSFSPSELAQGALSLSAFLLDEFEPPNFPHLDTWACVAAAFIEPVVVRHLAASATAGERALLSRVSAHLSEPAGTVCRLVATGDLPLAA
jgi:hypothetical protein